MSLKFHQLTTLVDKEYMIKTRLILNCCCLYATTLFVLHITLVIAEENRDIGINVLIIDMYIVE